MGQWKCTSTLDELRSAVYCVVFDVLGEAEGYSNADDILRELTTRPFFIDGDVEAPRHVYRSFEEFLTSGIMEDPAYCDGSAGGLLQIDYADGLPVFFRALPYEDNIQHFNDMARLRKRRERMLATAAMANAKLGADVQKNAPDTPADRFYKFVKERDVTDAYLEYSTTVSTARKDFLSANGLVKAWIEFNP